MAKKILAVDDEPQFERLILQRFRKQIREDQFIFIFAQNGVEALEKMAADPSIEMVLTDINMPQMDGLTLLSKLKESYPLLKTVVVSAYGDMGNIRKAMNLGAFDFVTKPIDFTDLNITIEKTLKEADLIAQIEQVKELENKNEKLDELNQLKSHFFTNISHELRTPLTVISGIANQFKSNPEKWDASGLDMIQRNSNQLLDLVNQILDLRKLESGKLERQMTQADIIAFLNFICEAFYYLAEHKKIQLHFLPDSAELIVDYDPDKLLRIISNLLSNAIKHTAERGHVYLMVSRQETQLLIKVKDTGTGIPEDKLPFIFDRYFQDDSSKTEGTGIGLALTRELVKLFGGSIEVESTPGKGSVFSVSLPVQNEAPLETAPAELSNTSQIAIQSSTALVPITDLTSVQEESESMPTLLIVEDNEDIINYLVSHLNQQYSLSIARNGQEGIDTAISQIPDIIISDVMMPEKDGLELTQTLKTDERTSHIPIVLLTAKSGIESKIAGLHRGADAYLSKPFHEEELTVTLTQLIEQRKRLQARYANLQIKSDQNGDQNTEDHFSIEDSFLLRAKALVEDRMQDNTFSAKDLCRQLGMSYSVLHRKLAAVIGRSPSLFIRSIRLQHAKQLLSSSDATISEIAYDSGFNDPKFFSRVFSAEFGEPPSTFRMKSSK